MTKNDIIDCIYDALAAYRKHFGHHDDPAFICLTTELENALIKLSEDDHYMLGIKFRSKGLHISPEGFRSEIESFMGLKPKWASEKLEFLNKKEEHVPSTGLNSGEYKELVHKLAEDKKRKNLTRGLR